ncbi:MAG: molybdate ABC transporter substrate-binding protein [Deltaproteobacteria bacterium]|nr:MAG: molybdate ABC transporter substrate-binding protein [Deltaproteobacteria bacterium]
MNIKKLSFIAVTLFFFAVSSLASARAEVISLSVAASMTDAFNEIIELFTAAHPDISVQPNFASSGSLARQIEQGAPADFFVSANPKWMTYLVGKKIIQPESERLFAYNSLVFISRAKLADFDLSRLPQLDSIAIGTPESVPAGQYAKQAMEKAGVFAALQKENKLILAKDVRQALMYADRGETGGAFVYKTDALLGKNAKIIFTVPQELYDRVSYPLGLTKEGAAKKGAQLLYAFMSDPRVYAILEKYGFEPAR